MRSTTKRAAPPRPALRQLSCRAALYGVLRPPRAPPCAGHCGAAAAMVSGAAGAPQRGAAVFPLSALPSPAPQAALPYFLCFW